MSQTFPPVRLAALDLDGTLLNHEGQVTPRTRAALQAIFFIDFILFIMQLCF